MTTATHKRIFISVDMDYKNHTMIGSEQINLKRDSDNFDKKYVRPINGTVIDAENIPKGAEVLLHHNATHETYMLFDYKELGGNYIQNTIRYFSIPESECYAWRLNGEWHPCNGFEFGLRVFKPHPNYFLDLLPVLVKNKLYITSGELKDKIVITKTASDYEMVFQEKNGKEAKLIRVRHFDEPENIREEIIAVDNEAAEQFKNGNLLIGYSPTNCHKYANKLSTIS
jgi:hypothetical protein